MPKLKDENLDLLEVDNLSKYIDYESCEKIAPKWVRRKFDKELEKNKNAKLGKYKFITVLDNVKGEYNAPRIIRSINALGGQEVYIAGTEFFNPYPSVGGFRHTKVSFFSKIKDCIDKLSSDGYDIFALMPPKYENTCSLYELNFSKKTAFIAGHEEFGLSFNIEDYSFIKGLYIPQHGKVESLNVSVAISIVASEYVRQFLN